MQTSLRVFPLPPCFEIRFFPENASLFLSLLSDGRLSSYIHFIPTFLPHSSVPRRRIYAFLVILASCSKFQIILQIIPFKCNNLSTFSPPITLLVSHLLSLIDTYYSVSFIVTIVNYCHSLLSFIVTYSSVGKESACNAGDPGSIPGLGRSPGEGIGYPLQYSWASLVAQLVKNLPAMWETWVRSVGWKDPLEKGKATHSSILAWRILYSP